MSRPFPRWYRRLMPWVAAWGVVAASVAVAWGQWPWVAANVAASLALVEAARRDDRRRSGDQ